MDCADVQDVNALHSPDPTAPLAQGALPALHVPPLHPPGAPVVLHLPLVAEKVASGDAVTVAPAFAHSCAMAWYESLLSESLHELESMHELAVLSELPLQ